MRVLVRSHRLYWRTGRIPPSSGTRQCVDRLFQFRGLKRLSEHGRRLEFEGDLLLLIAGQKTKRDTTRPQDCRDSKARGFVEVYVQYGAIHGCFSSHATRLVQVTDRTNGLNAETAQIGGDFFRKQIAVLDDEYFPRWHELSPPHLFCVRKRLQAIIGLASSSGVPRHLFGNPTEQSLLTIVAFWAGMPAAMVR
jgi:hypothetical protein